jgi:N-acetylneuraminic acid mutarotase
MFLLVRASALSGKKRQSGNEVEEMNHYRLTISPLMGLMVLLFAHVLSHAVVAGEDGQWTVKASMSGPRFGIHSAVIDQRIYVLGGTAASVPTGKVEFYDPASDRWTQLRDMPTPRGFFGTAAIEGKIYAIGGSINMQEQDPGIGTLEIYDPQADTWSLGTDMPTPRADITANAVNGKLYVIGGTRHVGIEAIPITEEYDPQTDTWTRKADMPTPRLHLSSAVVDGKIIVVGGGPEWPVPTAACEMYDPQTDTWTKMADMPTPRVGVWAASLNGKVYVMGGLSWENVALKTVEEFDPKTNAWRPMADMPTARFILTAESTAGQVFAIGGAATDFTTQSAVEALRP